MRRLFPDVPGDHPAMGSMLMNMAANMLGLGNAATPLGLRAMRDLEALNPHPGRATNAMCTFLAINTSSVQLIPTTAIAILVAAGSTNPTAIVGTALLATLCAATMAITAVKLLQNLSWFRDRVQPVVAGGAGPDRVERAESLRSSEHLPTVVDAPGDNELRLPGWGRAVLFCLRSSFSRFSLGKSFPKCSDCPSI
jgi:hypothetical protein